MANNNESTSDTIPDSNTESPEDSKNNSSNGKNNPIHFNNTF